MRMVLNFNFKIKYFIKLILRNVRAEEMGGVSILPLFPPPNDPHFFAPLQPTIAWSFSCKKLRFFQIFKNNCKFKFIIREKII